MPSVSFTQYCRSVNGYVNVDVLVNYSESYNVNTNQTTVSITSVQIREREYNIGTCIIRGSVQINGTTVCSFSPGGSASTQVNVGTSYTTIPSSTGSAVVTHNADGTGSFTLTLAEAVNATSSFTGFFGWKDSSYKVGITTPSNKTVTLTTRPRASSVSATNAYFGNAVTITISRNSSSFTHTVTATCAGRTETIMTKSSTYPTVTWTPAVANFAPLITTAMSATATITCQTYNGSTLVGTATTTCTLTFTAASVAPSVSMTVEDPMGYLSTFGRYIAGKSKIKVTLSNSLKYGASLSSTLITANGTSYASSPATTGAISSANNTGVSAKITDSRGQTATASQTIQIYSYSAPVINGFSVHRCNSDGTDNNAGAYAKVSYNVSITALGNHNTKSLTLKYKKRTDATYTSRSISMTSYSQSGTFYDIPADVLSSYNFQFEVTDYFSTTTTALIMPAAATHINHGAGKNGGIGIGKVSEADKTIDIASDWGMAIDGAQSAGNAYCKLPDGTMLLWGSVQNTANGYATIVFPFAFYDMTFRMVASPEYNGNLAEDYMVLVQRSTTQAYIYFRKNNAIYTNTYAYAQWIAIGRWKA